MARWKSLMLQWLEVYKAEHIEADEPKHEVYCL